MKLLFNTRLLPLLCFLLGLGVLASCKKENDTNNGQVQLYSFGPAGVKYGDTLRFIGQNLTMVTAIQFTGTNAEVKKADFKLQTAEMIMLTVPATAAKGPVTLKTPNGDIVTKTDLNLNVKTAVSITSVTKNVRPGENITFTGNYLNWAKRVIFAKNKQVTTFVSQSQNQLVVKVPDDAQTGPLVVTFAGTDTLDVQTADTVKVALPIAASFSPNPVKHGANVTITGTDLDLVKKIYFNNVATAVTTFASQSATQLVVAVPGAATKGKVTLEAASGLQTNAGGDLDIALPAVTGMTPNPVAIDANVTITGTNMDLISSVIFPDTTVGKTRTVTTFVSQSATQLVVKVPGGASSGKLGFGIKNSSLTVKSAGLLGIVGYPPPAIIIYTDALSSTWNGWIGGGWGGTKDLANSEQVKSGTKSIKIAYDDSGYGVPLQLGGANIPLDGYSTLKVSIYGGAGSGGKNVNIGFNEQDGKTVALVEGQWNDFVIPLNQISSATTLTHLYIKKYSSGGAFTIYVDDLGIF